MSNGKKRHLQTKQRIRQSQRHVFRVRVRADCEARSDYQLELGGLTINESHLS